MINHEKLLKCLKTMIEETHKYSIEPEMKEIANGISKKSFLKEHRTVKFGVGRQMGHTTMAIKLFYHFPWAKTVFVVPNISIMKYLQEKNPTLEFFTCDHDFSKVNFIDMPRLFIIDPASFVDIDRIYNIATLQDFFVLFE